MSEWRQLDWLPNYEVSEDGLLRRTIDSPDPRYQSGYVLRGFLSSQYRRRAYKVMMPDGTQKKFYAHQLVCEAWYGPPPPKHEAAHWNGDLNDNHYSNLRWATKAQNGEDTARLGVQKGERNPGAKLTEAIVREIRSLFTGAHGEINALAKRFGIGHQHCSDIVRGKRWRHLDAESET